MEESKVTTSDSLYNEVDFIGIPPSWLLKSGITLIGTITLTLLFVAYFIKYPDKIATRGIITTDYPPIKLVSMQSGIIGNIYRKDNEYLNHHDTVLYIKNSANPLHINLLSTVVHQIQSISDPSEYLEVTLSQNLLVGELQSHYARFNLILSELKHNLNRNTVGLKIEGLKNELNNQKKLEGILRRERTLSEAEFSIIKKEYQRNQNLHDNKVISDQEFEKATLEHIRIQKAIENSGNGLIQNRIRQNELKLQMSTITDENFNQINNLIIRLREATENLSDALLLWDSRYVLRAEKEGTLIFSSNIHEKMFVSSGTTLASIIPRSQGAKSFVKVFAPSKGVGKIREGHRSLLKVDGFPYKEFGVIESKVQWISMIPEKNMDGELTYEMRMSLSDSLVTNYGLTIPFQPDTGVICEIITEDRSILERVFENFLDIIKNN